MEKQGLQPKQNPRALRGLTLLQLLAILILPLTIMLLLITFASVNMHQNAMRSLVGDRDERAVRTAASALSAQLNFRSQALSGLAILLSSNPALPVSQTLSGSAYLLKDFDEGLAVFDAAGKPLARLGDEQRLATWAIEDRPATRGGLAQSFASPGQPIVIQDSGGSSLVLLSAKSTGGKQVTGAFTISRLAQSTLLDALPPGNQMGVLLMDSNRQVLYHVGQTEGNPAEHPGVAQALQGQSGVVYVPVKNDEHVTAYSPVAPAGWALITEESWESVSTPTLRTTQVAPLILVPALLVLLLAVAFGVRQVIRPLQSLESRASQLARGNFQAIKQPVGGIAEIRHLQVELVQMSEKVQAAQQSLHHYIGAITQGQEEERRRLARELHDDTLQSLIALKQRVQLAQLKQKDGQANESLQNLETLVEQTIQDLRRVTRALRPVYLEDLGLVAALEMLVNEVSQKTGLSVVFKRRGVEQRLNPEVELAFYRMAQEALSNTTRHAQAQQAVLSIAFDPDSVTLQASDNGKGFQAPENVSSFAFNGHYGLLGLYERAELIGAVLEINSSPVNGTTITVSLDIKENFLS